MTRSTIFTAVAFVASAVSALSAPAFAAELPTVEVRYGDLRLDTPEGAKALQVRVQRAARSICTTNGTVGLRDKVLAADCQRVALAKAMPQVELALANAQNVQVAENSRVSVSAH